jgi:hypothetical protein
VSAQESLGVDRPVNRPSWEIKRRIGSGAYRMYAHGYFSPTWSVTIFTRRGPRTIIGRKRIERAWSRV